MGAWIFKVAVLNNSPADLLQSLFLLNKWTYFIFTRSLLLRCVNQIYTWSLVLFGSLPLHKYYLYAPTPCGSLLCWLALDTQGSFYWFLEGLHAGFFSSLESHFQEWASHLSFCGASSFLWYVSSLKCSIIWLPSLDFLSFFFFSRNYRIDLQFVESSCWTCGEFCDFICDKCYFISPGGQERRIGILDKHL